MKRRRRVVGLQAQTCERTKNTRKSDANAMGWGEKRSRSLAVERVVEEKWSRNNVKRAVSGSQSSEEPWEHLLHSSKYVGVACFTFGNNLSRLLVSCGTSKLCRVDSVFSSSVNSPSQLHGHSRHVEQTPRSFAIIFVLGTCIHRINVHVTHPANR